MLIKLCYVKDLKNEYECDIYLFIYLLLSWTFEHFSGALIVKPGTPMKEN